MIFFVKKSVENVKIRAIFTKKSHTDTLLSKVENTQGKMNRKKQIVWKKLELFDRIKYKAL